MAPSPGHLENLARALRLLREQGFEEGTSAVMAEIEAQAAPGDGMHVTATRAWCALVAASMSDDGCNDGCNAQGDVQALLRRHPELGDRDLLRRYYEPTTLGSPAARIGWIPPDREPLPLAC